MELEIPDDWWVWHGFRPYIRAEELFIASPEFKGWPWIRLDPMDREGSLEDGGFPLLKPSIDTLGIPSRSRKQRGWYQILSPAHSPSSTPQRMRSAADLPMELIFTIAETAVRIIEPGIEWSRHDFASWALVCRHWAEVLQPAVFRDLTIRTYSEMTRLLRIRRTSLTRLAQSAVDPLALEDKLGHTPFTHLATRLSTDSIVEELTIIGPLPTCAGTSLRSIHGTLPRSLPGASVLSVRSLKLEDIHFRYFLDLVRVVLEIPALDFFAGSKLTWESESAREGALLAWVETRRSMPRLAIITLMDCIPHQHHLALLLTGRPNLYGELGQLVQCIDEDLASVDTFSLCAATSYPRES